MKHQKISRSFVRVHIWAFNGSESQKQIGICKQRGKKGTMDHMTLQNHHVKIRCWNKYYFQKNAIIIRSQICTFTFLKKMPFELSDTIRGLFKVRFLHSQQVENGLIKYVSGNNTCQYFSHFMVFTTSKASYELHLPQHTYTSIGRKITKSTLGTIKPANFIR